MSRESRDSSLHHRLSTRQLRSYGAKISFESVRNSWYWSETVNTQAKEPNHQENEHRPTAISFSRLTPPFNCHIPHTSRNNSGASICGGSKYTSTNRPQSGRDARECPCPV